MRQLLWALLGVVLVTGGILLWNRAAEARVRAAVSENNAAASTATAQLVESNGVEIGELRSHLATSQEEAAGLRSDNSELARRSVRLGRELASAMTSNATLELQLEARPPTDVIVTEESLEASFAGQRLSNGDRLSYTADLFVPFSDPNAATLRVALAGELTIDTEFSWEDTTPICSVSVRHNAVLAVPGQCVSVLGESQIEREANRIKLPAATAFALTGTAVAVGFLACLLFCP